ncbi:MAG: hypothetical protein KAG97_12490, partial [Victivallales bacterium]|nr:hypothetical protein [Victivallales bacterium]
PLISTNVEKSGKAGRLLGDFRFRQGTISAEYMKKSPYFSPLTSYNDMEHDRLALNMKMSPKRNVFLALDYLSRTLDSDMTSGVKFATRKIGAAFEYRFKAGTRVGGLFETQSHRDNRATHLTDNDRNRYRVEGRYPLGKDEKILTEVHYERRNLDDATDRTSDQRVTKGGVSVSYSPDNKLNVKFSANNNRVFFSAPAGIDPELGSFSATTFSNVMGVTWRTSKLWTFSADVDTQKVSDTRNITGSQNLHRIRTALRSKQLNRYVKGVSLSFDRQDRPNPAWGGTRTEAANLRVNLDVNRDWSVTPGYTVTRAEVEERSKSVNNTANLRAVYRGKAEEGWSGTAQFSSNDSISSSRSAVSGSPWTNADSTRFKTDLTTNYKVPERYDWRNVLTLTRMGSGGSGDTKRYSLTSKFNYNYSPS